MLFYVARTFNMRFILLTNFLSVQYSIIECSCNVVQQVSRTFPTLFEPLLKYLGYFKTSWSVYSFVSRKPVSLSFYQLSFSSVNLQNRFYNSTILEL